MFQQYYDVNNAIGVNVELGTNGQSIINCCRLSVVGSKLIIDKKIESIAGLIELKKHIINIKYSALNLSGKAVLHKQTSKIEELEPADLNKLFPNAVITDFYIQNFVSGEISYISIIRKTEADYWIKALKEIGCQPLMLSLGVFPVANILEQLNVYGNNIQFNGYAIELDDELHWRKVTYSESFTSIFPLKIETEPLEQKIVIPYAAAFQLVLFSKVNPVLINSFHLDKQLADVISIRKLKVKSFMVLMFFFLILLLNFIAWISISDSNVTLQGKVDRIVQSSTDIQSLENQIKNKEELLTFIGWDQKVNINIFIDQAASVLPETVRWTSIIINPINVELTRINKSISFTDRTIQISGNSDRIIDVNEWIARLKMKPWVKEIQLSTYTFNNEQNTGQFIIIITY